MPPGWSCRLAAAAACDPESNSAEEDEEEEDEEHMSAEGEDEPHFIKVGARRLGAETVTGLVEQHDFGGRRFDVVLICQTVDHLLDVAGTLRRVRELLTENGRLFIDIVDFRAAYLRHWSVEEAVKIDHPYYLTEPAMVAYLQRTGFEVARADYAADHLHVSYVAMPAAPRPDALPPPDAVAALWREVRAVQNIPARS